MKRAVLAIVMIAVMSVAAPASGKGDWARDWNGPEQELPMFVSPDWSKTKYIGANYICGANEQVRLEFIYKYFWDNGSDADIEIYPDFVDGGGTYHHPFQSSTWGNLDPDRRVSVFVTHPTPGAWIDTSWHHLMHEHNGAWDTTAYVNAGYSQWVKKTCV